jgi:hypothetical protein
VALENRGFFHRRTVCIDWRPYSAVRFALAVEELMEAERNRHADGQDRFDALRRFREGTAS